MTGFALKKHVQQQCDQEVGKQPEEIITASLLELHKCKPSFTLHHLTCLLCCLHFVWFWQ